MGREPRPIVDGATYHVMARGNRRQSIFASDNDRSMFLAMLARVCRRYGWQCLAYCLMGNHVHLAVMTPKGNLSDGMRDLLGRYAWLHNQANGLSDHLFRSRFRSVLIEADEQLVAAIRYIARNPRRGGLVERAEDWPWSSYPALLGLARAPSFFNPHDVLSLIGQDPDSARATVRRMVEDDAVRRGTWPTVSGNAA